MVTISNPALIDSNGSVENSCLGKGARRIARLDDLYDTSLYVFRMCVGPLLATDWRAGSPQSSDDVLGILANSRVTRVSQAGTSLASDPHIVGRRDPRHGTSSFPVAHKTIPGFQPYYLDVSSNRPYLCFLRHVSIGFYVLRMGADESMDKRFRFTAIDHLVLPSRDRATSSNLQKEQIV
jgi:hypothetical protein